MAKIPTLCRELGFLLFVWNKFLFDNCFRLSFCFGNNVHRALVVTTFVEFHCTVNESIERIVFTDGNILTGIVLCATLANDDVACQTLLTTPDFHAESLSC